MSAQPHQCRVAACRYCYTGKRRVTADVCSTDAIVKNCFKSKPAASKPAPPKRAPTKPARRGCVYFSGGGKVVIRATELRIGSHWNRVGDAIVWKKGGGQGIDAMGSGTVCANVRFRKGGVWYMTAVSSAPHPTEHNDAWFRFSGGVDLYRPQSGSFKKGSGGWYKGFQNNGGNKPADYIVTIDHNGHQFLTKPVRKGKVYQVCVSGRSTKFSLYKLVFIKCDGGAQCSRFNSNIKQRMLNLNPSRCV